MKNSVFRNNVDTKEWFIAAGIRALKTFAQALLVLIPVGTSIAQIDWKIVLGVAAGEAFLSIVTSIAGIPEVEAKEE